MAELNDLRVLGYQASGDSGFGAFGDQPPGGFQRVGYAPQGGLLSSVFKFGKGLIGKIAGGGSSKLSKAAKEAKRLAKQAAQSPAVRAGVGAAVGTAAGVALPGAVSGPQQVQVMPAAGGAPRAPSIIYDPLGRAWRRAGVPVLWSGDLRAVRRVNKAASRARRAAGSRRSVQRGRR
jgi:hypothetical protein